MSRTRKATETEDGAKEKKEVNRKNIADTGKKIMDFFF
jgi:hypothetical protein